MSDDMPSNRKQPRERWRDEFPWVTSFDGFNWVPTSAGALIGLSVVVIAVVAIGTWLFGS